jgi:hypothetical protein
MMEQHIITLTSKSEQRRTRVHIAQGDAYGSGGLYYVMVKRLEHDGTQAGAAFEVGALPPIDDVPSVLSGNRVIIVLTWDGVRVAVAIGTLEKEHNDLEGLQGGDPPNNDYFHLSEDQLNELIDGGYITPVPETCDQNVHPGDEEYDVDGTEDDHPGDGTGTAISDDPDGYTDHPGAEDCYTTR